MSQSALNGFGLIYSLYRYKYEDGRSKDWLIAKDMDDKSLRIYFGKTNGSLQQRRIPESDSHSLELTLQDRLSEKLNKGYEYVGEAGISAFRAVLKGPDDDTEDDASWHYVIDYSSGDNTLFDKACELSALFNKHGFRTIQRETHVDLGDVKIYRKRPPRNSMRSGKLTLPKQAMSAMFLFMLSIRTQLVELSDASEHICTSWKSFREYEAELPQQILDSAVAFGLRVESINQVELQEPSCFF